MTDLSPFELDHDEVEGVVNLGPQHAESAFPAMYILLLFDVSSPLYKSFDKFLCL